MTIATFCRDELLAHGPLSTDDLVERAADRGVTRSLTPGSSVLAALRGRAVQLGDGRWVTPRWLLEGRCLTTPNLPQPAWSCDPRDTTWHDLRLLHLATQLEPLPLLNGGVLRSSGWRDLRANRPLPQPSAQELLCLRVIGGALEVTTVAAALTWTPAATRLMRDLDAVPAHPGRGSDVGTAVLRRLAELILADDALLREPVPPLSVCSDALAQELERQAAYDEAGEWDEEPYDDNRWYDQTRPPLCG